MAKLSLNFEPSAVIKPYRRIIAITLMGQGAYIIHPLVAFWLLYRNHSIISASLVMVAAYALIVTARYYAKFIESLWGNGFNLIYVYILYAILDLGMILSLSNDLPLPLIYITVGGRWALGILLKCCTNRYLNALSLSVKENQRLQLCNLFGGSATSLLIATTFWFSESLKPMFIIEVVSLILSLLGWISLYRRAPLIHSLEHFDTKVRDDLNSLIQDTRTRKRFLLFLVSQGFFLGLDMVCFIYFPVAKFQEGLKGAALSFFAIFLGVGGASLVVWLFPIQIEKLCKGMFKQQLLILLSLFCFLACCYTNHFSYFLFFYALWNLVREIQWLETDLNFSSQLSKSNIPVYLSTLYSLNGLIVAVTIITFATLIQFLGVSQASLLLTALALVFGAGILIAWRLGKVIDPAISADRQTMNQFVHDIRSPIGAIQMVTHIASGLAPQEKELLDVATKHLASLSDAAIREIQRKGPVSPVPSFCLKLLTEEVIRSKIAEYGPFGIEIIYSERDLNTQVMVDRTEMSRVLSNLINNAFEAYPSEAITKRVELSLARQSGFVILTIRDFGKGIAKEVIDKLFQNGFSYGKPKGSGLGLFHAKGIVEKYSGTIGLKSIVNEGTELQIALPNISSAR